MNVRCSQGTQIQYVGIGIGQQIAKLEICNCQLFGAIPTELVCPNFERVAPTSTDHRGSTSSCCDTLIAQILKHFVPRRTRKTCTNGIGHIDRHRAAACAAADAARELLPAL